MPTGMRVTLHIMRSGHLAATIFMAAAFALGCQPSAERPWQPSDHEHPDDSVEPAKKPAEAKKNSMAKAEDPLTTIWLIQCSSCHGKGGLGDGKDRPGAMPNFAENEWQKSLSDEAMEMSIRQGKGMMPAFGEKLPKNTTKALVGYIRKFREVDVAKATEATAEKVEASAAEKPKEEKATP